MKLVLSMIALALLGCMASQSIPVADAPAPPIPAVDPLPAVRIIELHGTPTEIGSKEGQLLGTEIRYLHDKYLIPLLGDGSQRLKAILAAAAFEPYILPEHSAEITALGESSGINHSQTLLAQCFLDISQLMDCSTIALPPEASPDGVARFGRNLDFPSLGIADKHSVVLIVHPQGRYAFAAVTWPGLVGVLSGMNEHGLCLANMEVDRSPRLPSGMPYTLLYRMILERCKTTDEAIALLNSTPRQTANNLMIMDAAGDRAVAEIRPEAVTIRRGTPSAALLSTNHQRAQDMHTAGLCWRYDKLHQLSAARFGHIDPSSLQSMLGAVEQGDHGNMTLQSMIFEPATRALYLSTGSDAANKPFARIDLKPYFATPR